MNDKQSRALLTNPQKLSAHMSNGGWRPYVLSDWAQRFDELAAIEDVDELDRAIASALAAPDGWAYRVRRWAETHRSTLRRDGIAIESWGTLTAAGAVYLVGDLQLLAYQAHTRARYAAAKTQSQCDAEQAATIVAEDLEAEGVAVDEACAVAGWLTETFVFTDENPGPPHRTPVRCQTASSPRQPRPWRLIPSPRL
jgi:hypothetical protein